MFKKEVSNLQQVKDQIEETRSHVDKGVTEYVEWFKTQNNDMHVAFEDLVKYINQIYREKKKQLKTEYLLLTQGAFKNKEILRDH